MFWEQNDQRELLVNKKDKASCLETFGFKEPDEEHNQQASGSKVNEQS